MENGEWTMSVVDGCQTEAYRVLELKVIKNINATLLLKYSSELSELTNTLLPIFPQDIITISNILNTVIR